MPRGLDFYVGTGDPNPGTQDLMQTYYSLSYFPWVFVYKDTYPHDPITSKYHHFG